METHNPYSKEILMNLLYALFDQKIDLELLIPHNDVLYAKFKDSFISRGRTYNIKEDMIIFEKEIVEILGDKYKEGIKKIVKSKYVSI